MVRNSLKLKLYKLSMSYKYSYKYNHKDSYRNNVIIIIRLVRIISYKHENIEF